MLAFVISIPNSERYNDVKWSSSFCLGHIQPKLMSKKIKYLNRLARNEYKGVKFRLSYLYRVPHYIGNTLIQKINCISQLFVILRNESVPNIACHTVCAPYLYSFSHICLYSASFFSVIYTLSRVYFISSVCALFENRS